MVFMKKANKGGKPNQKTPVKKPFKKADIDMSDDDFDDDDSDSDDNDVIVTKTPKGKQSLGEKRVSFQVAGKNTPVGKNTPGKTPVGKKQATPAKGNSVIKKQATPGKEGLQKFKGMEKQNKNSKKGSQPEEDDDDDDDDDDSDDDDEDFSLGGGLGLKMKGFAEDDDDDDEDDDDEDDDDDDDEEDDEEEDDDDDDEDDEDDDDDEDEEEEINQKNSQNGKKQKVVQAKQSPIKANEKTLKGALTPKTAQTPKAALTPKSIKKESNAASPIKTNPVALLEEERRKERDAKQLYMGNLPKDVTEEEIKKLSSDINSAVIHVRPKSKRAFAFLQFASEDKAEENLQILKSKLFKGATLNVDYAGSKSSKQSPQQLSYDLKRLFVPGLPIDVTVHQISKFFPKSHTVAIGRGNTFKAATITFPTEEDATAAFNESKDLKINGVKVSVLHSTNSKLANKRKKSGKKNKNDGHPGKKMKFIKQEDSDDE